MVNMALNPPLLCLLMLCECQNLLRTIYGLNWARGTQSWTKYAKCKVISWALMVNSRETMSRDDFIRQQRHCIFEEKRKLMHKILTIYIELGHVITPSMCFISKMCLAMLHWMSNLRSSQPRCPTTWKTWLKLSRNCHIIMKIWDFCIISFEF